MMIAVALAGALVVYAWVRGYIDFSTEKSGQAILIQSIFNDGDDLLVYVQNVGEGPVQLEEDGCLYVDGQLVECVITNVTVSDKIATLNEGDTATLRYVGGVVHPGEKVKVKVTTVQGVPSEKYAYPAGSVRTSPVLNHFEFDTISSPQTSGTAFTITIRALNQYDEPFTSYSGASSLSYSAGEMSPTATGSFTDGVWVGNVTLTDTGVHATITTVAQANASCTGTSNAFDVFVVSTTSPPVLDHFEFATIVSPQTSGTAFSITIRAVDHYNSLFTGYSSVNNLSYSGGTISPTTTGNFNGGIWNGEVTVTGSANDVTIITVSQVNSSWMGTSNAFDVSDGAPAATWNQTYGGEGYDRAWSVVKTSDGGYAVVGEGDGRFWLVKTDSAGTLEWSKTYGETVSAVAYSVIQTSDKGFALAGSSRSSGDGGIDFCLIKTDASGNREWSKTYGGDEYDVARSVIQTSDGGYVIVGYTWSFGAGEADFWLIKTDESGEMEWDKTYGGPETESAYSVIELSNGGYVIAGRTDSYGAGLDDFWLVKTDESGKMEWDKTYGGNGEDCAFALVDTSDGGYALAGCTRSSGAGQQDFWLVKTSADGTMQWEKTYGGPGTGDQEIATALVVTTDGGFALAGYTDSIGDGTYDFWLVKTTATGEAEWTRTYVGLGDNMAQSLVAASDGGYLLVGNIESSDGDWDFWLVKTDEHGNIQ